MNFLFVLFALAFQAPQAAPPPPCTPGGTQYICGQQAPEDLVLVPNSDWVVASVFAGSGGIRLINQHLAELFNLRAVRTGNVAFYYTEFIHAHRPFLFNAASSRGYTRRAFCS